MKTIKKLVCLWAFLAVANTSQAQTKEETITWLKEKILNYKIMPNPIEISKIDECEVVIIGYSMHDKNKIVYRMSFPTNPTGVDGYSLMFNSKVVETAKGGRKYYGIEAIGIVDFQREQDLAGRFLKAINHLHTFCPKNQETF